jgi:hypothetical protein
MTARLPSTMRRRITAGVAVAARLELPMKGAWQWWIPILDWC